MLRHFRDHGRDFPWRRTRDPYAVLVGEILLQRTRGENVTDVYRNFIEQLPSPRHLAAATEESISILIAPLGLTKRAHQLKLLGTKLDEIGEITLDPARLRELPGVGPYAAHAVPIFASDKNLPLVDWVIARVLRRYFGLQSGSRPNHDKGLWESAKALIRSGRARDLWLGVLDFAADICTSRPQCARCPLSATCQYAQNSRPHEKGHPAA
jgi:A/G-specific adenine glycosylase